jgi:hypothetical protein
MKVLFIQNNGIQESIGVANLSGILKANGHDTDLLLVMVQELLFYRVRPIPALRYFHNTVLMTGKSGLTMTMRTIPSLFRRKARVSAPREIYEAGRGYF